MTNLRDRLTAALTGFPLMEIQATASDVNGVAHIQPRLSAADAEMIAGAISTAMGPVDTDPELPEFMAKHVLVAFHRGEDPDDIQAARNIQSDVEVDQQEWVTSDARRNGYDVDDVVVVDDPARAHGVTSLDPTSIVPQWEEVDAWDQRKITVHPAEPMHRPVLDIDIPAALIPSTTPGHHHLYIDKLMTREDYNRLLEVLSRVGIIEMGYAEASIERGYSSARLPWIKKESK